MTMFRHFTVRASSISQRGVYKENSHSGVLAGGMA